MLGFVKGIFVSKKSITDKKFNKLFNKTPKDLKLRELKHRIIYEKNLNTKEKLLLKYKSMVNNDSKHLHFIYMNLIDLYYKQRNERVDAIDLCIKYCKMDIEVFPFFLKEVSDENVNQLRFFQSSYQVGTEEYIRYEKYIKETPNRKFGMPSYKRLAIIYEKQGKIQEAIDISNEAISLGITDDTKSGFEGRILRLKKKLKGG